MRDDSVIRYRGPTDEARWRYVAPVSAVVAVERAGFTVVRRTGSAIAVGYAALAVAGMAIVLWLSWNEAH